MFRRGQKYMEYLKKNIEEIDEHELGRDALIEFLNDTRKKLLNGDLISYIKTGSDINEIMGTTC
ncbi:hypothetical protein QNH20_24940 [Neobacillus sp. WH10]|uniref:hypothetical protein n=1 Tax=Neobacillus sp. WH10 TaxID=3047873 RepID=UPI0024C1A624|nr:hypothetical protein [Neobacillus sp. WH10]WHY77281.1 hypothetical protein QNH20_24940 [Neobacillus sp. WH10]